MYTFQLVDFKNIPVISCVYKMYHPESGREYIGRTSNLRERMRRHWQELLTGRHKNPKITNTFNKYGRGFLVRPIIIANPEYCEDIEGKLLAKINLNESLNCHINSTGGWLGLEWSDASRKKLSDARKGKAISAEAMARAVETRKTSVAWKAHQERMTSPEMVAKAVAAASKPDVRARAVATRKANGHKPFSDESRQKKKDDAKARVFSALDWAVTNGETRGRALSEFNCSWGSLKLYQPEWELINGALSLPKRVSGEKSGTFKHGLSSEIRRKRTPDELAELRKAQSEAMSGENNPMFGRKHTDAARLLQSQAALKQAEVRKETK